LLLSEINLEAGDTLPTDARLAIARVDFEAAFHCCPLQGVLLAIRKLSYNRRIDLREHVFEVEIGHSREIALDVRHPRQFLVAVDSVLTCDHCSLDWTR